METTTNTETKLSSVDMGALMRVAQRGNITALQIGTGKNWKPFFRLSAMGLIVETSFGYSLTFEGRELLEGNK